MKALLLALALQGSAPWQNETQIYASLVCPTAHDANAIASVAQSYSFASTVERTHCLFMAFQGEWVRDTQPFGIGNTLYVFQVVRVEGYEVYVLKEIGEGYIS